MRTKLSAARTHPCHRFRKQASWSGVRLVQIWGSRKDTRKASISLGNPTEGEEGLQAPRADLGPQDSGQPCLGLMRVGLAQPVLTHLTKSPSLWFGDVRTLVRGVPAVLEARRALPRTVCR